MRPSGNLRILDNQGRTYIPKHLQAELGIQGKDIVPYFVDANCVLLIRKGTDVEAIIKGLDILKEDLKLRSAAEINKLVEGTKKKE